ncbi:putative multi-drug efflux transporter [Sphaerisporangium melleum]|uniref:Multi-drug efflux transporter n=1 Tax=Sphaerisporangium melleum TaxID=321316 RepID=A0A917VRF9_9ACTN|nr:putative multi-drug efflux transporter [Sphaerisporangium melleum]GII71741.1 putative multi-drug efflux transporter [Sphaerisporangium melleum]
MPGHRRGFWVIAAAFATSMAFSTVPTPLWTIYQRVDGFSTFMVTVAFTAYAAGVLVSLFLAGHISDVLGRRRVLLPAVLLEAVSAVVFLTSTSLGPVIAARVLSGLGVGMITATATAYLAELHAAARPGGGRARPELVAIAANLGGFAVGPLVSGALAEYAPAPLRTPYLIFLVLLLAAAAGVAFVPETVRAPDVPAPYRPQRISVPDEHRPAFFASAAASLAAFAVLGLFTSLAPGFVAGTLHHPSRALAGLVTFLVFGAAAGTQVLLRGVTVRGQLRTGLILMGAGLAAVSAAVWLPSLPLFLAGGMAAGAGAGVLFKGSVSRVAGMAAPGRRGEALAGLFLVAYLGLAVPVLGLGVATRFVPDRVALLGFAAVLVAVCAVAARGLPRR